MPEPSFGSVPLCLCGERIVAVATGIPLERKKLSFAERTYLPAIASGLNTTLKHLFQPNVTLEYPEQRPAIPAGYRGVPTLVEWIDRGGHWVLVVGYDTLGTESTRDDLILFADPSDTHDSQKDGQTEFNALRFESL